MINSWLISKLIEMIGWYSFVVGESVEDISTIVDFVSNTGGGGMDVFHMNYLKTGLTLW